MQDEYPDGHTGYANATCGWGSGINQLRTEVEICQDGNLLYPDTKERGTEPGIEATKDAAEGIMGIQIPYYVLIDMKGFADVIDALGGVDINVQERLPKGGPAYDGQPVDDWAFGWIEPGQQHMDGDTAQWYARSRYTTSDFDRMRRQRELQEAILAQFTPAERAHALPGRREQHHEHHPDRPAAGSHRAHARQPRPRGERTSPSTPSSSLPRAASTSSTPTTPRCSRW